MLVITFKFKGQYIPIFRYFVLSIVIDIDLFRKKWKDCERKKKIQDFVMNIMRLDIFCEQSAKAGTQILTKLEEVGVFAAKKNCFQTTY